MNLRKKSQIIFYQKPRKQFITHPNRTYYKIGFLRLHEGDPDLSGEPSGKAALMRPVRRSLGVNPKTDEGGRSNITVYNYLQSIFTAITLWRRENLPQKILTFFVFFII